MSTVRSYESSSTSWSGNAARASRSLVASVQLYFLVTGPLADEHDEAAELQLLLGGAR